MNKMKKMLSFEEFAGYSNSLDIASSTITIDGHKRSLKLIMIIDITNPNRIFEIYLDGKVMFGHLEFSVALEKYNEYVLMDEGN